MSTEITQVPEGLVEKDNKKLFTKIVREINKNYGYSFKLPEDTDYSGKYAHPEHNADGIKLRCQTDEDNDHCYGMDLEVDTGLKINVDTRFNEPYQYSELKKLVSTEQFKNNVAQLKQLRDLQDELSNHFQAQQNNLFNESVSRFEADETYDLVTRVARAIYKENMK